MGYDCQTMHSDVDEPGYERGDAIDELNGAQKLRFDPRSSENRLDAHSRCPEEMRAFLVACHQASVSIETMSKYLGLDVDTVRAELLSGIADWNAAQRATKEAAFKPRLLVSAPCD